MSPALAVMLNLFQHPRRGGMMAKEPCVYILANRRMGALYVGVTANLMMRLHQHRTGAVPDFTARYGIARLVLYEFWADMPTAIAREKQLKRWHRDWKINLIERDNPHWDDLAPAMGLTPLAGASAGDGP